MGDESVTVDFTCCQWNGHKSHQRQHKIAWEKIIRIATAGITHLLPVLDPTTTLYKTVRKNSRKNSEFNCRAKRGVEESGPKETRKSEK